LLFLRFVLLAVTALLLGGCERTASPGAGETRSVPVPGEAPRVPGEAPRVPGEARRVPGGSEAPSVPDASEAPTVIDDAGREVRLTAPARRVISLVPARTESILALGAGDRLIARTRYDLDPRLAGLPSLGNALNPSLEWLAAQRPDLVIAWADGESRTVVERLASLGIPAYATRVETLAELDRSLRDLGVLLALNATADSLRAAIADTLTAVSRSVAAREPVRVLYLVGLDPPLVAGPGTFVDELLRIAGAANVFADAAQRWPGISIEEAVRRDPDVIIISTSSPTGDPAGRLRRRPGWRDMRAVRSGNVHEVDADLFNRPGPRVGEAARHLSGVLHRETAPSRP
jgi:ABC-type Fe3+-hydroxamate transport system substrate-binding protein